MVFKAVRDILMRLSAFRASGDRTSPADRTPRRRLDLTMEPDCIYAVGDIHGCVDKLRGLERAIIDDARSIEGSKLLVFLGDYIDRGPDTAAVIDHLMAPPPFGFARVCLCGNHEEVLIEISENRRDFSEWLRIGGDSTLLSYGYDVAYMMQRGFSSPAAMAREALEVIPAEHLKFVRRLPASFSTPTYFFAHAGVRPGISLADQSAHDLLWIRDAFLNATRSDFGKMIVHGHTPTKKPDAKAWRIGVDTGAYMGGPLTAARLMNGRADFVSYG